MPKNPKNPSVNVSIVLPVRNERGHIETCIASILKQELPAGGIEVIVADGMSDDGTRDILKRLTRDDPRIRVIDNPGRIVSNGLNEGIKIARGNIIIRMDAHTEYAPDYVRECVRVLAETNADDVGGPWVARGNGFVSDAIAAAFQSAFSAGGARSHKSSYEGVVDSVYLGCWPRRVFDEIGLFDEGLVRNQDDEFSLRLTRSGGKIWQSPRIKCWYQPRGSVRALFRQYMQYGYWKVRVIQKHKIPASLRHIVPGSFVFLLLALPLISPWSSTAFWAWLLLAGSYAALNLTASLVTAAQTRFRFVTLLPVIFGCYHLGYGYGFLRGFWDFIILRRKPNPLYTALTRVSSGGKLDL